MRISPHQRRIKMGIEENKAVVKEFIARFGNGDKSVIDELTTENLVGHLMTGKGIDRDRSLIKQASYVSGHDIYADYSITIDYLIAEGDKVMALSTIRGTHTSAWDIPPTGKEVHKSRFTLYRLENGKIAETWNMDDVLGEFQQLGVLPSLPEAIQAYNESLK